jgi:hypothetical protein
MGTNAELGKRNGSNVKTGSNCTKGKRIVEG